MSCPPTRGTQCRRFGGPLSCLGGADGEWRRVPVGFRRDGAAAGVCQSRARAAAAVKKVTTLACCLPLEKAPPLRQIRPPPWRGCHPFSMNTGTGGRADPNLANWAIWGGRSLAQGGSPKMDQFARGPRRQGARLKGECQSSMRYSCSGFVMILV